MGKIFLLRLSWFQLFYFSFLLASLVRSLLCHFRRSKVATFRKRNGKWQAIVRHKDIGTTSRSFSGKADAIKWAKEHERQLKNDNFGTLEPTASL